MDFKVGLTDEAIADFKSISEYIARDSAEAAAYVGNELLATAESLAILPHRGAPVSESGRGQQRAFRLARKGIGYAPVTRAAHALSERNGLNSPVTADENAHAAARLESR